MLTLSIAGFDLIVLVVYLLAVVAIGVCVGRGTRDLSTYLLGNRHLPWFAILGSIVATETSTATFLSVPGMAFDSEQGDLRFLQLALGFIVGRILIVWLLLPWYFRGELFTAYQLLEERFGGVTKRVASIVFLVTRNLGDGLRLFLTAIVLEKVAGVPLPACIVVIGVATIAYTFFGGMRAVVWNDCLQFVVYMVGGLVAGAIILQKLPGGWSSVAQFGELHHKFRVFDFHWSWSDPYTFWAGLVGGTFLTLGTHGTDQMMVQRYLSARSLRDAGRALILSGGVVLVQFTLFLLLGVGLACFYATFPPTTEFPTNDHVFASFIVHQLPAGVGLIGIVLAAVFAAAMSTLSSSLNSSAASAVNDLYAPLWKNELSSTHLFRVSRLFTILFGIVQIAVGISARHLTQSVVNDALAIAGFSAGLLLGVFALGVLVRRANERSVLIGLLAGLICLLTVRFVLPWWDPRWTIAWTWLPAIGSTATFGVGWCASYLGSSLTNE